MLCGFLLESDSTLLESFLDFHDSSPIALDLIINRKIESSPYDFEKNDVIDRALRLGSVLTEAAKRSARRRASGTTPSFGLCRLISLLSTLAQKRASRMLESFKGKGNASAPLCALSTSSSMEAAVEESLDEMMMSQENKAVKQLVQQSLHSNMNRMVKRANLPHDFVPSQHLRSLTSSSTSKSLPF